ncbi:MAG: hypothetical protein ACXIT4_03695 [Erythrobacter sp.]
MPEPLDNVKALAAEMRRTAQATELDDPPRARRLQERSESLEAVCHELEEARKRLRPIPSSFGDLSDLPEAVLSQLNLSKVDELEQQMRDIIAAANGDEIGLDPIIIELYRRHRVVQERKFVMNKLYRMAQKGIINSVDGKKGVYCLPIAGNAVSAFDDDLDGDIPF